MVWWRKFSPTNFLSDEYLYSMNIFTRQISNNWNFLGKVTKFPIFPRECSIKGLTFKVVINIWLLIKVQRWSFIYKVALNRAAFTALINSVSQILELQTSKTEVRFFVREKWRNFGWVTKIFPERTFPRSGSKHKFSCEFFQFYFFNLYFRSQSFNKNSGLVLFFPFPPCFK